MKEPQERSMNMYDDRKNWMTKITHDKVVEETGEIELVCPEQTMGEACIMFDALDKSYDPNGYTVEVYKCLDNGERHLELRKHVNADETGAH